MRCKLKMISGQTEGLVAFLADPDVCFDIDDRKKMIERAQFGWEINVDIPLALVLCKLRESSAAGLLFRPPGCPRAVALHDPRGLRQAFQERIREEKIKLRKENERLRGTRLYVRRTADIQVPVAT
ncbi:MAG TPA: hypothetical protein VMR75_04340 [Candidatus Saccharimonadales bacterium]|nr:hypothetical protein [Candidatus Saccharimonadales bacterium]